MSNRTIWLLALLLCSGGCGSSGGTYDDLYSYVVKRIVVPETAGHAQKLVRDIDGDGDKENALGSFLATMKVITMPHGCDQSVNTLFSKATTLLLLDVKGNLKKNLAPVKVNILAGADGNSNSTDNFSGSAELKVVAGLEATLEGTAPKGAMKAGRSMVYLPMAPAGEAIWIEMNGAQLEGKLTPTAIEEGVLSGGVSQLQIKKLLPAYATALSCVVNNPIGGSG